MTLKNIHVVNSGAPLIKGQELFEKRRNCYLFHYPCTSQSKCTLISVTFPKGVFQIECWGASGGDRSENHQDGGRGGYTRGDIAFSVPTTLYLSIGANGNDANGTYGGGGSISSGSLISGGGATDIRLVDKEDFDGLKSRIMVAAAGGGAVSHGTIEQAGYGGGLIGGLPGLTNNTGCQPGSSQTRDPPLPANQTAPSYYQSENKILAGKFGIGGNTYWDYGGSGAGGYYGGSAGSTPNCYAFTGSGGSSFISGHEHCDAIAHNSTEQNIYHTGQSVHFSHYFFTSSSMRSGDTDLPVPSLTSTENTIGHRGNGFVRITILVAKDMCQTFKQTMFRFHALLFALSISS